MIGVEDHPVLSDLNMELFSGPGSLPLRPDAGQQGPVDGRSRAELCQVNKEVERVGGQLNDNLAANPFTLQRCKSNE